MMNSKFKEILDKVPLSTTRFVNRNFDLIELIYDKMDEKGWKQKDLAKEMKVSHSTVSKWLSGLHSLDLKTIAKLEVTLGSELVTVNNHEN